MTTATAREHFKAGRLSEAINAAGEAVKRSPADVTARLLLAELLCFTDLQRADKHFEAAANQHTDWAVSISFQRRLLRAAVHRRQFYEEGRPPQFLREPTEDLRERLRAAVLLREGTAEGRAAAAEILEALQSGPPPITAELGETAHTGFRDLDDLTGQVIEVLAPAGAFYWVPMEQIESIEFQKPQDVLEYLWRQAQLVVRDGPSGEVCIPALYHPPADYQMDEALQLGRATAWDGEPPLVRGVGQRMYLLGEEAQPIHRVERIALHETAARN